MTKIVLYLVITALVSYLLGGINGAILTSKLFFRKDVRKFGSGNAGLTNYTRNFGSGTALLVILVDVLKAVISVALGGWLLGLEGYDVLGKLFAGFCVVIGHIYPAYYHFHGGKGVLCGCVLSWMVDWRLGLICISIFIVTVVFTKYVSLGSILGTAAFPFLMMIFGYGSLEVIISFIAVAIIIFAHRENIVRLIKGQESKLSVGNNSTRPS